LKDIWPSNAEIQQVLNKSVTSEKFASKYADVFSGDKFWQAIKAPTGQTYDWVENSTYVRNPPYFTGGLKSKDIKDIKNARILAILGDSITTDHISPAGNISKSGPSAKYLTEHGVAVADFNSYGARRGNHEVMMRGTFANIRIKNEMLGGEEGGNTIYVPNGEKLSIYDASMKYQAENTALVVFAGKEYGTGSSRDWAAKGTNLLGIKAVIAESFERIHRSNLVGMGILPLVFKEGDRKSLELDGSEIIDISGIEAGIKPRMDVNLTITRKDGSKTNASLLCRIDTLDEIEYFKSGGILQYVLANLIG
ncbi:MAG: aconitate hydratase, partial [Pseudomonadota bacterium]